MDTDRTIGVAWRVWPWAAVAAVVALIVFGARDEALSESVETASAEDRSELADVELRGAGVALLPDAKSEPPAPLGPAAESEPEPEPSEGTGPLPVGVDGESPPVPTPEPLAAAAEPSLEERARALAQGLGARMTAAVEYASEHVDVETLRAGGETLGRFLPFVGPYLRYAEARRLYRSGATGARDRARRLVVIALADLALDAGSAGLNKTATGSWGLLEVLDGAIDLAELSATALMIRDAFGNERSVEALAGRALAEIDGLEVVVEELLTVDVRDPLDALRGQLSERGRSLVEAVEQALRGRD